MVYFTSDRHIQMGSDFFTGSIWNALARECVTLLKIVSVIGIVIVSCCIACDSLFINNLFKRCNCGRNWGGVDGVIVIFRRYWYELWFWVDFQFRWLMMMVSDGGCEGIFLRGEDVMLYAGGVSPSCSLSWRVGPLTSWTSCTTFNRIECIECFANELSEWM